MVIITHPCMITFWILLVDYQVLIYQKVVIHHISLIGFPIIIDGMVNSHAATRPQASTARDVRPPALQVGKPRTHGKLQSDSPPPVGCDSSQPFPREHIENEQRMYTFWLLGCELLPSCCLSRHIKQDRCNQKSR